MIKYITVCILSLLLVGCKAKEKKNRFKDLMTQLDELDKKNREKQIREEEEAADDVTTDNNTNIKGSWQYIEEEDRMTDGMKYFAQNTSINKVEFASPYGGGSTLSVSVRNKNGKEDVCLILSKGQFGLLHKSNQISVRFDKDEQSKYEILPTTMRDTDMRFIKDSEKFIKNMKGKKTMLIEAAFYKNGLQVFEFNVEDFEWNH